MNRPKVIVWQQASVDGRLAISPGRLLLYGDERWAAIQGEREVDGLAWIKTHHAIGATLEGSGSFVRDEDEPEPLPPVPPRGLAPAQGDPDPLFEDYLPASVVQRPGHRGWFMVVDGRGRGRNWIKDPVLSTRKDGAVFGESWAGWHLLILAGRHTPAEYLAYLRREEIPYLVAGQGPVDLRLALQKVMALLDVNSVLPTAGGRLNGALLRASLVDEVNVEFLPAIVGGRETPSLFAAPSLGPDEWPTRLELISVQASTQGRGAASLGYLGYCCAPAGAAATGLAGGRVWLRYRVLAWPAQTPLEGV